jgi:hypothetical protein
MEIDTVLRCLGVLAAYGFIERGDGGWRLRRSTKRNPAPPKAQGRRALA